MISANTDFLTHICITLIPNYNQIDSMNILHVDIVISAPLCTKSGIGFKGVFVDAYGIVV